LTVGDDGGYGHKQGESGVKGGSLQ
jgi:hypothetical protein